MISACALLLALWVDHRWGEPPVWAHPVVGMGRYLGALGPHLYALPAAAAFALGALAWSLGAALCVALAWALQALTLQLPAVLAVLVLGLLLKPLLALRLLCEEVTAVEAALQRSLPEGRAQLSRLVSRDTTQLSADEVREAALETLSENLSDSVLAPLLYFALAGLPGAALYRFANTADAMWGYRGRYEWAGKWAARADDLLNLLPARLTGLMLCAPRHWPRLRHEARATPSPNGGWPMGALALQLGLRLSKPGVYVLNAAGRAPCGADIAAAVQRCRRVAWGAALLMATLLPLCSALLQGALA
ncbi:adenosylcobinamide-phosphate synthase CbiB [Roseateles sp. BYS180W]|uniref:Cobalamin biosynthesis protein CobD n=1 Tax=Roseateles rivi TaxID=3299028 RepID=A0ABW7FX98_9BURK